MRAWMVVGLLAVATTARAQPADTATAKEFVDAGVAAQKKGDFDTAIAMYEKANATAPHPSLLFNIAQAHRLAMKAAGTDRERVARHRDSARDHYRKFLATNPEGDLEITAQGWLAKLDQLYESEFPAEEAARREREAAAREAKVRAEQARLAAERKAKADRDALEQQRIADAVREQQLRKARTVKIVGLGVAGGGVVAITVGAVFGLKARRISNELTDEDVYDPARMTEGENAERNMAIAYVAGGALLVGGAVTYFLGHRIGERANQSTVAVVPARGGATFVVGVGF